MIMKSQNNNARPMEIFLYLFTIAPTISVPPVLPFAEDKSETCPAKECTNNNGHERLVM